MDKKLLGIVRDKWSRNEYLYYLEALDFYDAVIFIDSRQVQYRLDRESNKIHIEYNGFDLTKLSMLYTFGYRNETLILIKSLQLCGCVFSDPYCTVSRECLHKMIDSFNLFENQTGTTSHILTSYKMSKKTLSHLSEYDYPLINKPVRGNKGRGIVKLNNYEEAISFSEKHFKRSSTALVFEKFMNYSREFRVYLIDGKITGFYEKVTAKGSILANIHQGAKAIAVDDKTQVMLTEYIESLQLTTHKLGIYGIDIALTESNTIHIIEINRTPGFRGFNKIYKSSFPSLVHQAMVKRARLKSVPQETNNSYQILFLGDTNPGETYQLRREEKKQDNILKRRGYDEGFKDFQQLLNESDYTIANLEAVITNERVSPFKNIKPYLDWTDAKKTPQLLKTLKIDAVSLANNHSFDYGENALSEMLEILDEYNILHLGAGLNKTDAKQPLHHHIKLGKHKLHFIFIAGFEYRKNHEDWGYYANDNKAGVNDWSRKNITVQIKQLRSEYPEAFIIAFPHWGSNYCYMAERQQKLAHLMIDAGVNLIIGHGSHMMQEIEKYKESWILYGIGNFIYNSPGRFRKYEVNPFGLIPKLCIKETDKNLKMDLKAYPIFIDNRITDFKTRFINKEELTKLITFFFPYDDGENFLVRNIEIAKNGMGYYFILPL